MSSGTLVGALIAERAIGALPASVIAVLANRRLSVAALSAVLLRDPKYELLEEVRGAAAVRQALDAAQPAIVVVDGTSLADVGWLDDRGSKRRFPVMLVLDPAAAPDVFLEAAYTRASGFLSSGASGDTFALAIAALRETGSYLDGQLEGQVLMARKEVAWSPTASRPDLSQRQHDILVRIASGQSTKQVARACAITPKTVGNHVNHIYEKLNLRDRGQLVLYAVQRGLTTF